MITSVGKTFIKRYLAGQAGAMVGAISVGIGNAAPTVNDQRMQFEFERVPVNVTAYDFSSDVLVFKGTLDENVGGVIYEVALWTSQVNNAAGNQASRVITSFDSDSEDWGTATFINTGTRIGPDSLRQAPAASATVSNLLTNLTLDFIDNSSSDAFIMAYNVNNANAATVKLRFRTDASNYYEYTVTAPAAGYQFSTFQKGTATVVGVPSWADINEVEVLTTAKSTGAASVDFDGIRLEDIDTVAPDYGLIARYVLSAPITKVEGIVQDVEYALPVTV